MNEMLQNNYRRSLCPITRGVAELGDSWSLLIVRECFLGFRRFDDFRKNLNMSKSVLSRKLQTLVNNEILITRPYQESGQRSRLEYLLSDKGKELYKVIISLIEWGNLYADPEDPKLAVFDRLSGQDTKLVLRTKDHKELGRKDIRLGLTNT
ncbi:MAG: helix-turn-helix domain-containing protein [Bacteroidota bacterium]